MISSQPQTDLHDAKEYFRAHLAVGDFCATKMSLYYFEKNTVVGEWIGEGATRLKLIGTVFEAAFVALCEFPARYESGTRSAAPYATFEAFAGFASRYTTMATR